MRLEIAIERKAAHTASCDAHPVLPNLDRDLAYQVVLAGLALDYRRYSGGHYEAPEHRARILKRGIWAGTFVAPWDWRQR